MFILLPKFNPDDNTQVPSSAFSFGKTGNIACNWVQFCWNNGSLIAALYSSIFNNTAFNPSISGAGLTIPSK